MRFTAQGENPELGEALVKVGDTYYLVRLDGNKPIAHVRLKPVLIKEEAGEEKNHKPLHSRGSFRSPMQTPQLLSS